MTVSEKTEKKYRELLALQEREGLSRDAAAARGGIKPSTLTWWRCEIARRDRERNRPEKTKRVDEAAAALVPVTVREAAPKAGVVERPAPTDSYEIVLASGRVLRVPRVFDSDEVLALVRLLEAGPC